MWMLYIASKPLGTWFGSGGGSVESGSPLDQAFLSALLCISFFILASRNFCWYRAIRENYCLMLLIIYMLLSVLWSDVIFISFKRWIRELIAVVMAFLVLNERNPRQAMLIIFRRTIYILIPFSILLIKYFPIYGVQYSRWSGEQMWIGVTNQKNGLGRLCLIAAFFLIWVLFRKRQKGEIHIGKYQTLADVSVLSLALFLISGPGGQYSATALVSLAAGLVSFVCLLWINKHRISLGANTLSVIMALFFCLGFLQPFIGGAYFTDFASDLGRDLTLTGRTEIWAGLLPDVMRNPILGSGMGSFWTSMTRNLHDIGEAHNGYLDVLLDFGVVGLLLIGIFIISSCRKAQRELRCNFDWACLWICFLIMALIHNMSESSINSLTTHLTSVLLFLAVSSTAAAS